MNPSTFGHGEKEQLETASALDIVTAGVARMVLETVFVAVDPPPLSVKPAVLLMVMMPAAAGVLAVTIIVTAPAPNAPRLPRLQVTVAPVEQVPLAGAVPGGTDFDHVGVPTNVVPAGTRSVTTTVAVP